MDAPTPEASWSEIIERTIAVRVARAVAEERIRLSATLRDIEDRSYQRGYAKALEDADAVLAASLASLARSMSTPAAAASQGLLTGDWLTHPHSLAGGSPASMTLVASGADAAEAAACKAPPGGPLVLSPTLPADFPLTQRGDA